MKKSTVAVATLLATFSATTLIPASYAATSSTTTTTTSSDGRLCCGGALGRARSKHMENLCCAATRCHGRCTGSKARIKSTGPDYWQCRTSPVNKAKEHKCSGCGPFKRVQD